MFSLTDVLFLTAIEKKEGCGGKIPAQNHTQKLSGAVSFQNSNVATRGFVQKMDSCSSREVVPYIKKNHRHEDLRFSPQNSHK